jgi:hypothetical protein
MKITTPVLLLFFLVVPGLIFSAEVGDSRNHADHDTLVVSGIGYPPIKAQSAAQAHLMARRAAILDAYRNALASPGSGNSDEQTYYTGLSGFVKGMVIEKEEYLGDGGLRILARVPARNITVSSKATRGNPDRQNQRPSPVPLNEWYKIIERSVRFE